MDIVKLVSQPDSFRDQAWESEFFQAFVQGKVELISEAPQQGPDGWPYILVKTTPNATEDSRNILAWASNSGVGIVVNSDKQMPDYIFTFGMIWNFRERAHFLDFNYEASKSPGQFVLNKGDRVLVGGPSESALPGYVRSVLKEFFKQQEVDNPKVVVIQHEDEHFDVAFSLESLGSPEEKEHKGILEFLSWFFPMEYSLVLLSESDLEGFVDL